MAAAERRALAACAVAFAALAGSSALADGDLGRLFTTADERARLDRLRRGEPLAPAAGTLNEEPARPNEVTGFVRRSDGRNTVWIDGVPTVTRSPKAAPLLEPGSGRGSDAPGLHVETRPAR